MNPHIYLIKVEGSIISEEGNQYAQGWVAGDVADINKTVWKEECYNEYTHSFSSDLILNKKKRAVPYAIYIANGSIGLKDKTSQSAELICMPGFSPALAYLDDYLKEIESYISMRIPSGVVTPFFMVYL